MVSSFRNSRHLESAEVADRAAKMPRLSRRQSLGTLAAAALGTGFAGRTLAADAVKKPIRLVVLDIGGTLIEDHGEVPNAMASAFAKHGLTISFAEIGEWRGASKRGMVRHFVELRTKPDADREGLTEAIYDDFSTQASNAYRDVKAIKGAEDALKAMRAAGFILATTTGFDRKLTDQVLGHLGWRFYFVAMITSDDVVDGRPSPFMIFHAMEAAHVDGVDEVVAVGDTPLDLQAAANARVRGIIGVYSGAATKERLEREVHTHILASIAELPALL